MSCVFDIVCVKSASLTLWSVCIRCHKVYMKLWKCYAI